MVEIRCKSCGGLNHYESLTDEMECGYCGVMLELDEDRGKFVNLYRKADDAWDRKDFDEALRYYEQIVDEDVNQSEAHWGAAMCRYGVAYVMDPLREVKMPTCNRVNRTSILEDKNYLAAIRHAGPSARKQYERRAQEIDRISRQFLKIVEKEKPYDVFISYKKTGNDGRNTIDSQYARKLYHYLTEKGVKVFFAEETLAEVAGSMYEPYIFAALTSAKVMVLMGSCRDHFEAVWVKNEWHRFLALQETDPTKALIPVCIRCKPEDELPLGLNLVQAMDADHMTFLEDVAQIVQKKKGAAPQAVKAGNLNLLSEKYATKANVDRVVSALDCEPELAAEVLIIHQGKIDDTIRYISSSSDYQKKLWICSECDSKNTHDVCHNPNCGISKADSFAVRKKREEIQRENEARQRREEEQRRREYERSKEAKQIRKAKRSAKTKKFFKTVLVLVIIAAVIAGIYALLQRAAFMTDEEMKNTILTAGLILALIAWLIRRLVASEGGCGFIILMYIIFAVVLALIIMGARTLFVKEVDDLYTPEVVRTYSDGNDSVLIISNCSEDGTIAATWIEVSDGSYLKVDMQGRITSKKNNGNTIITWESQDVVASENASWTDETTANITERYQTLSTNKGEMHPISSLYVPQIVQPYCSENDVLSFTDCTADGRVTGLWECWGEEYGESYYVKLLMDGQIVSSADGSVTIRWIKQEQLSVVNTSWNNETYAYISDNYNTLSTDSSQMTSGVSSDRTLSTAQDLQKLANSDGIYFLANDIDLSDTNWKPIEGFTGTLYGNGHAIQNMTIASSNENLGFFSTLSGSVNNLVFENATVTATNRVENVGILCGLLTGMASNVTVSGTVDAEIATNVGGIIGCAAFGGSNTLSDMRSSATVTGNENVGGIVGYLSDTSNSYSDEFSANLKDLVNEGSVTANGSYAGGIVGYAYCKGNGQIALYATALSNTGAVQAKQFAGGLFGYGYSNNLNSYINDSSNASDVTGESIVGGIAGKLDNITVNNCENAGSTITATGHMAVEGVKYAYLGGFVGDGYVVNNCTNTVDILYDGAGRFVGGIMGYSGAAGSCEMRGLKNTATVSGSDYVGGIVGSMVSTTNSYSDFTVTISDWTNSGAVSGDDYVGGVMGHGYYSGNGTIMLYASGLSNTGAVSGSNYVGGLIGEAESDSTNSIMQDCKNASAVTGSSYVGGLAGYLEYVVIDSCDNTGSTITASGYSSYDGVKYAYVGGYVGFGYLVNNCTNTMDITYTGSGRYVGGIAGFLRPAGNYAMDNLKNTGNISGASHVAGVIGGLYTSSNSYSDFKVDLYGFENTGTIKGKDYTGGLIGFVSMTGNGSFTMYATNMTNTGSVSGAKYVGGIFGYAKTDSKESKVLDVTATGSVSGSSQYGKKYGYTENVTFE